MKPLDKRLKIYTIETDKGSHTLFRCGKFQNAASNAQHDRERFAPPRLCVFLRACREYRLRFPAGAPFVM